MRSNLRFALSAVLAAVVFGVGYVVPIMIPGAGNTIDKDFTNFYSSDQKMGTAVLLFFVLVAGSLIMLWFFNELRARLPEGMLSRVGYAAAGDAVGGVVGLGRWAGGGDVGGAAGAVGLPRPRDGGVAWGAAPACG